MWVGVILLGMLSINAATLIKSPQMFNTEEACQVWLDDTISTLKAANSFKPVDEQVMALAECRTTDRRHT